MKKRNYTHVQVLLPEIRAMLAEANELIDRYIYFYNYELIQLKTGEAPLARRLSA